MQDRLKIDYNEGSLFSERQSTTLWAVGLSLLAAAVIALGGVLYITHVVKHDVERATMHDATVNCINLAHSRVSGDQFRFAIREELSFIPALIANAQARHKVNRAGREFLAQQLVQLNRNLAVERRTIPGLPRHISSYGDLFGLLADTPLLSCKGL